MARTPTRIRAEPWTWKLLHWPTRHRTGVTRAAAAVQAGVVGLSTVLARLAHSQNTGQQATDQDRERLRPRRPNVAR
jgi:hypothetical protein